MKSIELVSSFSPRGYQQSLFANTMKNNSLIVLPTGLGKTIIALMHAVYHHNNYHKKILFLAPTKPLVEQHERSFRELIANTDSFIFQTLTGTVAPKKRIELYNNADIVFSTPQLIENDIINGRIDKEDFSLVIIDEAHKATGGYAYCFIAEEFSKNAQILALTASPGTSEEEIKTVMENLYLDNVEVKRYEDEDVKPYVQKTNINHVEVELTKEQKQIKEKFDRVISKKTKELQNLGIITKRTLNKREILELQSELRKEIGSSSANDKTWKGISLAASLMKIMYGQELFDSQDFGAAYTYFHNFFRQGGDKSKAAEELTRDIDFRDGFESLKKLEQKNIQHPKLDKLKQLLNEEFSKNPQNKIIIFNQYRETAQNISKQIESETLKPVVFVGQNKKGNEGMSQKQQKKILEEFRSGIHNILISTSVGEEGLDIPKVDTVIFYEPVPSAIRTIQRIGRTGRFNEGNAYVLQTKGTKDVAIRYVATAKEKRMYSALEKIRNELGDTNKQKDLGEYFNNSNKKNSSLSEGTGSSVSGNNVSRNSKDSNDSKATNSQSSNTNGSSNTGISILVDSRENADLIKQLFRVDEFKVEATQLTIGDIVVSEEIAIERKAVGDFVTSLIDKRLFPQLIDLAKNYRRPILLIEGDESLYAQRNLNPNVIRSALSSIAVDLRMPILYTSSLEESVELIKTIVKRQNKDKKALSLVSGKKGLSDIQEVEKVVSSIPKVNAVTAKQLLFHFNSLEQLANATIKELEEVEGIGSLRAQYIYDFMRRKYLRDDKNI